MYNRRYLLLYIRQKFIRYSARISAAFLASCSTVITVCALNEAHQDPYTCIFQPLKNVPNQVECLLYFGFGTSSTAQG